MTNHRSAARSIVVVSLFLLPLSSCGGDAGSSESLNVVLLGDATRIPATSVLSAHDIVSLSTPPASSSVLDVADAAMNADVALVVTDVTQGPTPIVREHILLARQLRIPTDSDGRTPSFEHR